MDIETLLTFRTGNPSVTLKASVMAGLKWAPDTWPSTVTSARMAAGGTRVAARGDTCPVACKAGVAQDTKTRRKVPRSSAAIW